MVVCFACLTNGHKELGKGVSTCQGGEELSESLEVLTTLPVRNIITLFMQHTLSAAIPPPPISLISIAFWIRTSINSNT